MVAASYAMPEGHRILVGPFVAKFLKLWLPSVRDRSEHTIRSYSTAFVQLGEYMYEEHGIGPASLAFEDLTLETLSSFFEWLHSKRELSVSSVNVRMGALRSFARYVQFSSPGSLDFCIVALSFKAKKCKETGIKFISREAMTAVINEGARSSLRDQALLQLLYASGARESEFIGIDTGDVHLGKRGSRARIELFGKGKKARTITVDKKTTEILRAYIAKYAPDPCGPLFFNRYRKRLSPSGLKHIVAKYGTIVKERDSRLLGMDITPHVFRHSIATHMLRAGVTLEFLRLFLGHESIETTRIYAKVDPEAVSEAVGIIDEELVSEVKFYEPEEKESLLSWLDDDYLKRHVS